MNRIAGLACIVMLFVPIACKRNVVEKRKPNILFILADDFGNHDMGCAGSTYYETPNLDKLSTDGMRFTQGYAACQVCSPSRGSIMSGQYPARHGITDWIGAASGVQWRKHNRHNKLLPAEYVHQLNSELTTLPEALKMGGYVTFFAGKWHLGGEGSMPEDHGFDINKGGWEKGSPAGGYFSPFKNPYLEDRIEGENLSMRLALETSDFIKAHKDTAFLAYLSFYAVHGPIQTTQEKWKKYRDKAVNAGLAETGYDMAHFLPIRKVQDNPVYAGLIEHMDEAIGVVMKTLQELGLDENTIVVFTSDNGGVASGDAFSTSNLPLRGGKGYQWEGGIREPYFIKVPWLNTAGRESDVPVSGIDFLPTLLELTAVDVPTTQHVDGVSLVPLLEGKAMKERPLFWHYPHYGNQGGQPSSIVRLGEWKLIHFWEDGRDELYNVVKDIAETTDLAQSNETKAKELRIMLDHWLKGVGAKIPQPDPEYDELKAMKRHNETVAKRWPALEAERLKLLSEDFDPENNWWGSKVTRD